VKGEEKEKNKDKGKIINSMIQIQIPKSKQHKTL
jgi:hypothetical protein